MHRPQPPLLRCNWERGPFLQCVYITLSGAEGTRDVHVCVYVRVCVRARAGVCVCVKACLTVSLYVVVYSQGVYNQAWWR